MMKQTLKTLASTLLTLALVLGSLPGHAEVDPYRLYLAQRGDIPWESLSPEEQKALQQHRGKWDSYSSDRQRDMRKGARRYMELSPEKRRQVDKQRHKYEKLSPEERKRLREEYRRQRN